MVFVVMKYPAAVTILAASVLSFGCDAQIDRTETFELGFNDNSDVSFSSPEHGTNLRLWLEADLEAHDFHDAKIEFSRIQLGTCVEGHGDVCESMSWAPIGAAHLRLGDLNGGAGLIDASQVELGEYDELRFTIASGYVYTDDGYESLDVINDSVTIPLAIDITAERRLDVRVLFDAPASIQYDVDDGWTLDAVLTVEDVEQFDAP